MKEKQQKWDFMQITLVIFMVLLVIFFLWITFVKPA